MDDVAAAAVYCVVLVIVLARYGELERSFNSTLALMNQLERSIDALQRYFSQSMLCYVEGDAGYS